MKIIGFESYYAYDAKPKHIMTEKVFKLAGTKNKLLSQIRSCRIWYFGQINIGHMIEQQYDNIEGSVMIVLVEGAGSCGRPKIY